MHKLAVLSLFGAFGLALIGAAACYQYDAAESPVLQHRQRERSLPSASPPRVAPVSEKRAKDGLSLLAAGSAAPSTAVAKGRLAEESSVAPPSDTADGEATGRFHGSDDTRIQRWTLTEHDRHSTFAVDVDTASYAIARRTLKSGAAPTPSLVRVEEFINYFRYDYDAPTGRPFAIHVDGAVSPVAHDRHLLRVGLQSQVVSNQDRRPANIVFLVDTSCSMTSRDKLALAQGSLKIAASKLGPSDRVAITTYAGGVDLILPPTAGDEHASILAAIDSLSSGGGTAMQSGLQLAYRQAAQMHRAGTNTRIVVCSDGDANIGATSHQAMLAAVAGYVEEGIRLSTIGFGDGNYQDELMEQLANKGNGNYFYIDDLAQARRVFGRDFTKMIQDVAQDVKIQVELDPAKVRSYRLVGYENRDIADRDFRNDAVDAGEIGAGHQVSALYELQLAPRASGTLGVVRVRSKVPGASTATEVARRVEAARIDRPFAAAAEDFRFATAVMAGAELLRGSPYARGWTLDRVISVAADAGTDSDPDRAEFVTLMMRARASGIDRPHRATR